MGLNDSLLFCFCCATQNLVQCFFRREWGTACFIFKLCENDVKIKFSIKLKTQLGTEQCHCHFCTCICLILVRLKYKHMVMCSVEYTESLQLSISFSMGRKSGTDRLPSYSVSNFIFFLHTREKSQIVFSLVVLVYR